MKTKKNAVRSRRKSPAKVFQSPASVDIVHLILADHRPLKKLLKILKDTECGIEDRKEAFEMFSPLFSAHSKPEEQSLYAFMKKSDALRKEAFEGDVEHALADQMLKEAEEFESDEDLWSAKVKVLAGLVEDHIKEEESKLLPDFRKHSRAEQRATLGRRYLDLKSSWAILVERAPFRRRAEGPRVSH